MLKKDNDSQKEKTQSISWVTPEMGISADVCQTGNLQETSDTRSFKKNGNTKKKNLDSLSSATKSLHYTLFNNKGKVHTRPKLSIGTLGHINEEPTSSVDKPRVKQS